ncbi:DUF615 domain-containing protein, partial [bacterium]
MSDEDDFDPRNLPPSKSMRKREALGLQKLGEELVALRAEDLATLPLDESLRDAIDEARRLTSRGALARQRQYIGKLMRDVDVDRIREALLGLTEARNARAR